MNKTLLLHEAVQNTIDAPVVAKLMFEQLEYWFSKNKSAGTFYKFTSPCSHVLYRTGDSWEEELGASKYRVASGFAKIGIKYKSSVAYDLAERKGSVFTDPKTKKELYFCAIYDRSTGLTFYKRNGSLIEKLYQNYTVKEKLPVVSKQKKKEIVKTPSENQPAPSEKNLPTKLKNFTWQVKKFNLPSEKISLHVYQRLHRDYTEKRNTWKTGSAKRGTAIIEVRKLGKKSRPEIICGHSPTGQDTFVSHVTPSLPEPAPTISGTPETNCGDAVNFTVDFPNNRAYNDHTMKKQSAKDKEQVANEIQATKNRVLGVLGSAPNNRYFSGESGEKIRNLIAYCLACRIVKEIISESSVVPLDDLAGCSPMTYLKRLVSDDYSDVLLYRDIIYIYADGIVTSWPEEAKGYKSLLQILSTQATTDLEVEDCLIWMKKYTGYKVSLSRVAPALQYFRKYCVTASDGRASCDKLFATNIQPKSVEEKSSTGFSPDYSILVSKR